MIKKITLEELASFKTKTEIELNKVNFVYGGNGTGKTTISKVLQENKIPDTCEVLIDGTHKTVVYNKPFVDLHFNDSSRLKGIYTLGSDSVLNQEQIKIKLESLSTETEQLDELKKSIDLNTDKIAITEDEIASICWGFKKDVYPDFKEILKGKVGNKILWREYIYECLNESDSDISVSEIGYRYKGLFENELHQIEEITLIEEIDETEINDALSVAIIGNTESVMGPLIERLSNADWVKQGNNYLDKSVDICPYCQQLLPTNFKEKILEFFNDEYEFQINNLNKIYIKTESVFSKIVSELMEIKSHIENDFNIDKLVNSFSVLNQQIMYALQAFKDKIQEPSRINIAINVNPSIKKVNHEIMAINKLVKENNANYTNFASKVSELKTDLMKFMKMKVKPNIENRIKMINGIMKTNKENEDRILKKESAISTLKAEIKELESKITSIRHSVNEINKILNSFGYEDFFLELSEEKGFYRIRRKEGTLVGDTLSEGEKRFITFLYFYQLVYGSTEVSGINEDKVIVIDDPISSLDSSILYIVSTLVKNLIERVHTGTSNLKQIIVLTHNVYFHKEITFIPLKAKKYKSERAFFILRKKDGNSFFESYTENIVETTYQMLWEELSDDKPKNKSTVYNTMRRILEYYFNIIGGANYEELISKFEGSERLLASSLLSYVNDGSHYISDDFAMCLSQEDIEKYIKVFKDIFEKLGHINHFNMMMRIEYIS